MSETILNGKCLKRLRALSRRGLSYKLNPSQINFVDGVSERLEVYRDYNNVIVNKIRDVIIHIATDNGLKISLGIFIDALKINSESSNLAFAYLQKRYERIINSVVKKRYRDCNGKETRDDIRVNALTGLWKAAIRFDRTKFSAFIFINYAQKWIFKEALARNSDNNRNMKLLGDFTDEFVADEAHLCNVEFDEVLSCALKKLDKKQRITYERFFIDHLPKVKIAKKIGITNYKFREHFDNTVDILRTEFRKNYYV